jgi:hypothetical protein
MKTINEQKKLLEDIECLINNMYAEINLLRNITYRYYLMHGYKVQDGILSVPETISFGVSQDIHGEALCKIIDHEQLNIESNFQQIKSEILRMA